MVNSPGLRIVVRRTIHLLAKATVSADPEQVNGTLRMISRGEADRAREARRREYVNAYYKARRQAGRDLGSIPPVLDPKRRKRCRKSFKLYCETYHSNVFSMDWSPNHLRAIKIIEKAVQEGGLFAFAMPRGTGKTSLCEAATLYATLYGWRKFVMIIGADADAGDQMLLSISTQLEVTDELAEDFPEVCFPLQCLEGIVNRARGQTYDGERTHIVTTAHELVLPTIKGSEASGAVMRSRGITGRIRGAKFVRPDGESVRPDLIVVDDPQTDESAASQTQVRTRMKVLSSAILGLAGPGTKVAGFCPCTVIEPGDMADQLLDRSKHPIWQGFRTQIIDKLPTNMDLWEEYGRIMRSALENEEGIGPATEFYESNRKAMDKGCTPTWPARFEHDEISATQNAMNILFNRPDAFWSEYMNSPKGDAEDDTQILASDIRGSVNPRGVCPADTDTVTAFVDVQMECVFWMVVAWNTEFGGSVLDWGTFPEQNQRYFQKRKLGRTLSATWPALDVETRLYRALETVCDRLVPKRFEVAGDADDAFLKRLMIDANWHVSTDVVYQYCKQTPYPDKVTPSHGRFVGASSQRLSDRKGRKGDKIGNEWVLPLQKNGREVRHLVYDTNYWKTLVKNRLKAGMGSKSALLFNGGDAPQLLIDHMLAEFFVEVSAKNRKVDEWKIRPSGDDNDWFDCLVGTAVGASFEGIQLPNLAKDRRSHRKRREVELPPRRTRA